MTVSPAVVGHLAHVLARVLPLGAADVQHALRPLVPGVHRRPVTSAPHRLHRGDIRAVTKLREGPSLS